MREGDAGPEVLRRELQRSPVRVALGLELPDLVGELGAFTFEDVVRELERPGRDPRETFVPFSFRDDVHDLMTVADLVDGKSGRLTMYDSLAVGRHFVV